MGFALLGFAVLRHHTASWHGGTQDCALYVAGIPATGTPPWGCCQAPVHVQVQEQGFRPSRLRVDAAIRTVSLVLCNDKLTTYGAPDVLQVSVDQLDGHFYRNACFADRPANQARPLHASFHPCATADIGHHRPLRAWL